MFSRDKFSNMKNAVIIIIVSFVGWCWCSYWISALLTIQFAAEDGVGMRPSVGKAGVRDAIDKRLAASISRIYRFLLFVQFMKFMSRSAGGIFVQYIVYGYGYVFIYFPGIRYCINL